MNMSFWNAAVGAWQQQQRMQVQGNNIANANTYGYKAEKATFAELMYRDVKGIDGDLPKGTGAYMSKASIDLSDSSVISTGHLTDYAIQGPGFFALYDPQTGETSYTRNGAFTLAQFYPNGANGEPVWQLSDGDGRFVLNEEGEYIVVDVKDPEALMRTDEMKIGVFDVPIYDGMLHAEGERFIPVNKNGEVTAASGSIRQGMLETSNVDLGEELVKVIEAQYAYSFSLKMISTSDEVETTINNLR
ncbi:MAG: flagellar hook-basal body complex protein [Firmicutes bacterium]|nr:flagellar hook-basal body complex protein [Bacillota bacterium]